MSIEVVLSSDQQTPDNVVTARLFFLSGNNDALMYYFCQQISQNIFFIRVLLIGEFSTESSGIKD